MKVLRTGLVGAVVLFGLMGVCSLALGADRGGDRDMVIHFGDGSSQTVDLIRPPSSIRAIEFTGGGRFARSSIRVVAATYGKNCGAAYGNVTDHLASACNGQASCEYAIDAGVLGDPARGCPKDYVAEWQCGDNRTVASIRATPEAGSGKVIALSCPIR